MDKNKYQANIKNSSDKPRMLSDAVRDAIRLRHLSYETEKNDLSWIS